MASTVYTKKYRISHFSELMQIHEKVLNHKRDDNIVFILGVFPMYPQNMFLRDEVMIALDCLFKDPDAFESRKQKHEIPLAIKLSIIDSNKHKCYTQVYYHGNSYISQTDYRWNFNGKSGPFLTKFISRYILLDSAEQMLPNDVLTLFCEDYRTLLESGDFSDVRLIVGSNEEDGEEVKEFAVHKSILSARTEVFAAMFKHSNTREAQQNRVEIPDVRVPVFELFLQFIYTAKVGPASYEDAVELFEVEDKYQIASLKEYYEQYLCENLDIESLAQTLLLADMHQASKLKSKCLEFFVKNGEQVMKTVGWTKISNKPDLLLEVVQCFVNSKRFKHQDN